MSRSKSDILIVGGGAAGLSAALAAFEAGGKSVTLVDDNPRLGGQIWRAELGKTMSPEALKLIDAVTSGRIKIVNQAQIFAAVNENCLIAETPAGSAEFVFDRLIIATGARERFLPFPGWTLPGVFGAGGLQAMVKGGLNVAGKRVVIAGTGALLLAVAEYLRSKGAIVTAIAEQTPAAKIYRFGFGLWRSPSKIGQAAVLRAKLMGIPYLTDCWVTSAAGTERVNAIDLVHKAKARTFECDYLACGFHLVPNIELATILGCKISAGSVAVDEFQRTSCENIYAAGEPTGIAGVEGSLIEGRVAGLAAAGENERARAFFARRDRSKRFGTALGRTFELRDELRTLATDETIVCRCEDVEVGRLAEFGSFRDAKLQTRCGMGPCQGRVCGPATEFLFGWKPGSIRPPIFPVKMENL
jgi:D-hydroxyproline dehydrogenase subunit alpha